MTDEMPAQMIVDILRNEIARLNDERLTLTIQLQHAQSVIANLTERITALEAQESSDD